MFATVNGVRLYFDVLNPQLAIGADDALRELPTLICIPGGPGGDHQTLRPRFDRFAARAQVIYLDPRGSGRSDIGAPDGWNMAQWGDDLRAFADALGIAKPIVLGVSGGAMVAAHYLARHPGHAAGAVLVNACARLDKEVMVAGFAARGGAAAGEAARAIYDRGAMEDIAPFFTHCLPLYARKPAAPNAIGDRVRMNFQASRHFFTDSAEAFAFDLRGKMNAVTCPVLALAGAHDPVTRLEWARELAASFQPGVCDLVEFGEASHMISSDEPERFDETVERFLLRFS